MKATRLTYNPRTNLLDPTILTFSKLRVENFEVLRWDVDYKDEIEIIEAERLYGDLFEENTEIKLLLIMKNGQEVLIEFDPMIYEQLNEYLN